MDRTIFNSIPDDLRVAMEENGYLTTSVSDCEGTLR